MPKGTRKQSNQPVTTEQKLASIIKSARDKMRTDKGLNGELDRLPQLTWILFLKLLDDSEKLREAEAALHGDTYKPVIKAPYRWRDWAADDEGMSGDQLRNFVNNDTVKLPSGEEVQGLLAYLRSLQSKSGRERADVIAKVFRDVNNRMTSGALLRDVLNLINQIHFDKTEEVHILSRFYEGMLKEMRDAAGDSGEFYTPRPVVKFMVEVTEPQLGDTIMDPACGTGGFLVESYEYLKPRCNAKEWQVLQNSIMGGEAKSLPLLLANMHLLLHGFEYPNIDDKNSLRFSIAEMDESAWVDVILTNPPFGGEEESAIQDNFPPGRKTKETALLFLQLIMRRLRKDARKPGRAAVVFPNGVLFGDGICGRIKEDLLNNYNLHTIVRLPNGTFAPYTSIPTNLLFFDRSEPTEDVWYYEIPLPEGRKTFSKTKPIQDSDFEGCRAWWKNREENEQAWKYPFRDAYHKALKEAQPHWEAAKAAEEKAKGLAQAIQDREDKIKYLDAQILDFTPAEEQKAIKAQVKGLKAEIKPLREQEREKRELAKDEQGKGDAIYWAVYNLDQKNPNSQSEFEHLPPEQLLADIAKKDQRVAELMTEIQAILQRNESGG